MFNHLTNQQNLADSIKSILQAAEPIAREQRPGRSGTGISRHFRRAYDLLTRFERAGWIPGLFEETLNHNAPGKFALEGGGLRYAGDIAADAEGIPATVADVLNEYLIRIAPPDIMDSADARVYLGNMTKRTFKEHVHVKKTLHGNPGRSGLTFSRSELDEFKANRRPRGRPTKTAAK